VSARAFAIFMALLAMIGLLGFGLIAKGSEDLAVGDPAPQTELPRLDGSGTGDLADYRGKWVLVNFWASWCDPCRVESPTLQRFYERHRADRFLVLGIDSRDLTDDALAFVREFDLTYPMLRDAEGEHSEEYGLLGFPESFLIDPDGNVALIRRGPVDEEYLERFVAPKLERQ
jgi:cytochrome c biogenesis protein CcmG, thiol:disulfide interchange protein DsbE